MRHFGHTPYGMKRGVGLLLPMERGGVVVVVRRDEDGMMMMMMMDQRIRHHQKTTKKPKGKAMMAMRMKKSNHQMTMEKDPIECPTMIPPWPKINSIPTLMRVNLTKTIII